MYNIVYGIAETIFLLGLNLIMNAVMIYKGNMIKSLKTLDVWIISLSYCFFVIALNISPSIGCICAVFVTIAFEIIRYTIKVTKKQRR